MGGVHSILSCQYLYSKWKKIEGRQTNFVSSIYQIQENKSLSKNSKWNWSNTLKCIIKNLIFSMHNI